MCILNHQIKKKLFLIKWEENKIFLLVALSNSAAKQDIEFVKGRDLIIAFKIDDLFCYMHEELILLLLLIFYL